MFLEIISSIVLCLFLVVSVGVFLWYEIIENIVNKNKKLKEKEKQEKNKMKFLEYDFSLNENKKEKTMIIAA